MKRIGAVFYALICAGLAMTAAAAPAPAPRIAIEDVARFYKLYDATHGHPTADQLQHDYLDDGSEGLHNFARLRNTTGARIAKAMADHPEIYADARRCMTVLPRVRQRVKAVLLKLGRLYPEAQFPPITIAVGRGRPVAISGPGEGVEIGLEALCATNYLNPNVEDRFVHVIAHEIVHTQQSPALAKDEHPTVLELALIEGSAEFVGELISGEVAYGVFKESTKGQEAQIEGKFVGDEDKTDLSAWFNNGTLDKPGDLGYWVGYRIAKSYYEHRTDKRAAIREILQMSDPRAFVIKSGWYPGIKLH
jgi:hypothetical protein